MSILSSFSLEAKVAIVTGAKRGLGKEIALAFARPELMLPLQLSRCRQQARGYSRGDPESWSVVP
jgi:hypothetical protein